MKDTPRATQRVACERPGYIDLLSYHLPEDLRDLNNIIPKIIQEANDIAIDRAEAKSQSEIAQLLFRVLAATLFKYRPLNLPEYEMFLKQLKHHVKKLGATNFLFTVKMLLSYHAPTIEEAFFDKKKSKKSQGAKQRMFAWLQQSYEMLSTVEISDLTYQDLKQLEQGSSDENANTVNSKQAPEAQNINRPGRSSENELAGLDYIISAAFKLSSDPKSKIPFVAADDTMPWINIRPLSEYKECFSPKDAPELFDELLSGANTILDLGAGLSVIDKDSLFQTALRLGKKCYAIDPVYDERTARPADLFLQSGMIKHLKSKDFPYAGNILPGYITDYAESLKDSIDLLVSAYALIYVIDKKDDRLNLEILDSIACVLSPGGVALLGPLFPWQAKKIKRLVQKLPNIEFQIVKKHEGEKGELIYKSIMLKKLGS